MNKHRSDSSTERKMERQPVPLVLFKVNGQSSFRDLAKIFELPVQRTTYSIELDIWARMTSDERLSRQFDSTLNSESSCPKRLTHSVTNNPARENMTLARLPTLLLLWVLSTRLQNTVADAGSEKIQTTSPDSRTALEERYQWACWLSQWHDGWPLY